MSSNNATETAELVRVMRLHSGKSKRDIAWEAKTSAAALVDYEAGRHEPKISTLRRIAEVTGCELVVVVRPRPAE
jgi:ribosome-binding protein aMBF1 (putative translation factor)